MDLLSSFFLILIVLMSGCIAVLADDLGRRLGKKRLHFRGIRPKRVAQIGTFLAGVVVSLLTIIIVSIASSGVREWLSEGIQASKDRDKALGELHSAQVARDKAVGNLSSLQKEASHTLARNRALRDANHKLDEDVQSKTAEISRQKEELGKLNSQIALLTPRIDALQEQVTMADRKVAGLDKKLAAGKEELAGVQIRLEKANSELNVVQKQNWGLVQQNKELEEQRTELTKSNADLQAQKNALVEARDAAQQELKAARDDLQQTQLSLQEVQGQLALTQNELANAEKAYIGWKNIAGITRTAPMIYRMGQEVARLSLPAGISFQGADNSIASLLRTARISVLKAGAMPNGNVPEAGLFGHDQSAEAVKKDLVSKVAGAPQPMVLVAYSMINAFKGEPVALEIVPYQNPLVYKRGDVVAETRIDGRKDSTTIYHLIAELGAQVRDQAKKDKMIPRTGSDELYGAVSSEDVVKLVADVKASDRPVKVRAIADDDTRAGDALKLSFVIR